MNVYGYTRTSTKEQYLDRGISEIKRFCEERKYSLTNIYTDKQSGKNFNRERYIVLTEDVLRAGDLLIITELDRLGRDKFQTMNAIKQIQDLGVRLMVLELPTTLLDLDSLQNSMAKMMMETINNMMLELYASMAHAEMQKREKRQREGIEEKKRRGEWDNYGRPRLMTLEEFRVEYKSVEEGRLKPTDLMRKLGMRESTYYKYRAEIKEERKNDF